MRNRYLCWRSLQPLPCFDTLPAVLSSIGSQTGSTSASKARPPAGHELLHLELERGPGTQPLYAQIRDGVLAACLAGSLVPGMRLPPEREMATALGVNRRTVVRAYQELAADGLVEARGSGGTLVRTPADGIGEPSWLATLPAFGDGSLGSDPTFLRDVTEVGSRSGMISFAAGTPPADQMPLAELRDCLDAALRRWGEPAMTYGPVAGFGPLRQILVERLGAGLVRPGDGVLVSSGITQGLDLAARTLIDPGDVVAIESPTYVGTLQTFALAGARITGIPVDGEGMRVDVLEGVLARGGVRLIVVQPTYQHPTGTVLSQRRRERLLFLARRHRVPILEEDAYPGLGFGDADPGPLKRADRAGSVIYLSTFSKTVSPGVRVGWIVAPEPVLARFVLAKQFSDLNTNAIGQLMLAQFLDSGCYERHVRRSRQVYRERRDLLLGELARQAPGIEAPEVPAGGFFAWCRLAAGPHARLLTLHAAREGVAIVGGEPFAVDSAGCPPSADRIRLCYTACTPAVAVEGVRRLAAALERLHA